jgi:hypothetical protein
MAAEENAITTIDCCPALEDCAPCDMLDFRFRMPFRPVLDDRRTVPVEVTLHFRLSRCAGPLSLGDILYSTTLLPGEKVRLFTSDRHSRFSFDSETSLAYRSHTTSEESFYMAGMANAVNNISVNDHASATQDFHSSAVGGGGGAGVSILGFSLGGSVSASSYDAKAMQTFAHNLTQHADSSSRHVETGVRAASSTSVGEVQSRAHSEGESEDHYESASRVFANPNRCHALTFLFYKLNKCQTVRWELVGIERQVMDPAAPTGVVLNDPPAHGDVAVIPDAILATNKERLLLERQARTSVAEHTTATAAASLTKLGGARFAGDGQIPAGLRDAALDAVDRDLMKEGLIDAPGGGPSEEARSRFNWERQVALPTAGVIVKGCLDDCDVCEPALDREIELELERKSLENELLKKQILLLDQAQEYRCCPVGEDEPPTS